MRRIGIMNTGALVIAAAATLLSLDAAGSDRLSEVAGRYAISPSSRIAFTVAQVGGGGISGVFGKFSGSFVLHPENIARSRAVFTLSPASVATGEPRVETFLRSSAVFDAKNHPEIEFRSISVTPTGADTATIEGILSARGVKRQETFRATLIRHTGSEISFHVVGDVFRSRYKMDVGTPIYSNVVHFDMVLQGHRS